MSRAPVPDVLGELKPTAGAATRSQPRPRPLILLLLLCLALVASACGSDDSPTVAGGQPSGTGSTPAPAPSGGTFVIGAIPDQDPEKLQRLYGTVATYLSKELGVPVEYKPVIDYPASISLFRSGDLDMVWFGGLTGVQAQAQVRGARAIVQRDIDEAFHSVFIASTASGIKPVDGLAGLSALKGKRFTFGSESSTSGRLMPEFFLDQAGVDPKDFNGPPGYSGSHDKTIALVEAGSYEAGALNEQVWKARLAAGQVDQSKVTEIFRTPPYHDYHWVIRPDAESRFGAGFVDKVSRALTGLDVNDATEKQILELFGATKFIPTANGNYAQIETVAKKLGLLN